MLKLYYSKGASALAPHILLAEVDADYELVETPIPSGAHQTEDFLGINPKGRVPVLETDEGVLTENPAILEYIAATHPAVGMLPDGAFQQAEARSLCAYLCATAHIAFAHKLRGLRWAREEASLKDMQQKVPQNMEECAAFLEKSLPLSPWVFGPTYGFCDPYLFVFERWLAAVGVDIAQFPRLSAHMNAMLQRSATRRALTEQGLA